MSTGRNDPCPCGSGKKYKQCCRGRDQAAERMQNRFGVAPLVASGAADSTAAGTWQVDLTPLPVVLADAPDAGPAVALVVERGTVLHVDMVAAPPSEAEAVAAELERVIAQAAGTVGAWPERVQVRDAGVAGELAARLAPRGVEVGHHAHLDGLDILAAGLLDTLASDVASAMPAASSPATWRGWGLPRDTVAEIFRAAAAFWRTRPWEWVPSDDPLMAVEGTSRAWTCAVLGNGGEEFGLALYGAAEDFYQMFEDGAPFARMNGPLLSLTFNAAGELEPAMRREVMAARWEVAGRDAYPVIVALNTPEGGLPREMAEDLARLLRAVPEFVAHHRDVLDPDQLLETPLEWRAPGTGVLLRLEPGPEGGVIELPWTPFDALAPCLPEGPGADPQAALALAADGAGDVDALVAAEAAVVERFAQALRDSGVSEATIRKHVDNVDVFVEMLAFFAGVPVRAVTEYDLRSILFDVYPRKVRDAAHRTEAMPVSLTRFFDFLAEHEGVVCPWARGVLAERDAYRERVESFPGGAWWDEGVSEWREVLDVDLFERAMVPWPEHADGSPWGPTMGPEEAMLEAEVQRRWLLWRDELVRGGLTDPDEVRGAAAERQLQWEQTPHPRLDGRTPLQAIQAERAERGPIDFPVPLR